LIFWNLINRRYWLLINGIWWFILSMNIDLAGCIAWYLFLIRVILLQIIFIKVASFLVISYWSRSLLKNIRCWRWRAYWYFDIFWWSFTHYWNLFKSSLFSKYSGIWNNCYCWKVVCFYWLLNFYWFLNWLTTNWRLKSNVLVSNDSLVILLGFRLLNSSWKIKCFIWLRW
jgi:hypothetical protein